MLPAMPPLAAKELAMGLPPAAWQEVTWREGAKDKLVSRFVALRVQPGHRDYWREHPWPELRLLVEWSRGEPEPSQYWFATLAGDAPIERLVTLAKLRWRIERDDQELKQELGLGHFEGRGWRGFHHHASLCIAAYGFLIREQATLPPTRFRQPNSRHLPYPPAFGRAAPSMPRHRHVPTSIATWRHRLAAPLARQLDHCPCCGRWRTDP